MTNQNLAMKTSQLKLSAEQQAYILVAGQELDSCARPQQPRACYSGTKPQYDPKLDNFIRSDHQFEQNMADYGNEPTVYQIDQKC